MKKIDLVHTAIIVVALLFGYSAVSGLIGFLSYLVTLIGDNHINESLGVGFLYAFFSTGVMVAACIVLIRNARSYTDRILGDEPEILEEDTPKINLESHTVVFALLIGMGIYTLIASLPHVLIDLYQLFANKVGSPIYQEPVTRRGTFYIDLLKAVLGIVLIYAAPAITSLLVKCLPSGTKKES